MKITKKADALQENAYKLLACVFISLSWTLFPATVTEYVLRMPKNHFTEIVLLTPHAIQRATTNKQWEQAELSSLQILLLMVICQWKRIRLTLLEFVDSRPKKDRLPLMSSMSETFEITRLNGEKGFTIEVSHPREDQAGKNLRKHLMKPQSPKKEN